MNSLSWLIYIIGMVEPLKDFLLFLAIFTGLAFLVTFLACGILVSDISSFDRDGEQKKKDIIARYKGYRKKLIPVFIAVAILGILIPKKETMILIAASEIGHQVITSDSLRSALSPSGELIQTWIKNETQRLQAEIAKRNAPQQ